MSIIKKEFSFTSSNGVNTIRGIKIYSDEVVTKGMLQISHGMVEHYDRYIDFMEFMAQQGFIVYMHDHLGHKHSVDRDEDLGYFAKENGYKHILKDLLYTAKMVKNENPGLKLFLLGHSMGSFYARSFAAIYPEAIDGLLISGTGTSNNGIVFSKALIDILIKIKGDRYRSEKINDMAFSNYLEKIKKPKTKSDWISRDDEVVDKYVHDKYCQFIFTLSGFKDLMNILLLCNSEKTYNDTRKNMPIFIFSGSMDPVGSYGMGVMKVYELYKKAQVEDVKVKIYDGGRHEMINELNKNEVYEDIKNWLISKVGE